MTPQQFAAHWCFLHDHAPRTAALIADAVELLAELYLADPDMQDWPEWMYDEAAALARSLCLTDDERPMLNDMLSRLAKDASEQLT